MPSSPKQLAAAFAAFALCASPTMAAATGPGQSLRPLAAVGLFGTPASAQAVCAQAASATAAAGAAVAAQGQAGCVLPATDAPPPVAEGPAPLQLGTTNFGVDWLLLGLGMLALVAGISTLFDDDDLDIAPISPS